MIEQFNDGLVYFDGKRIRARDISARYVRDYLKIFRDGGRFNIPEDRLVFRPGSWDAGHSLYSSPGETMVIIKLIHGGYVSAMYLGQWETWSRGGMRFRQYYGGTVMTSDGTGPYRLPDEIRGRYLDAVGKVLSIDAERPVMFEDIQDIIRPGQERKSPAESVSELPTNDEGGGCCIG